MVAANALRGRTLLPHEGARRMLAMSNSRRLWAPFALLCLITLSCGPQEVGEECEEIGDDDECEDGAICTNIRGSNEGYCAWLCENDAHCAPDFECEAVAGTRARSCQPR